MTGYVLPDGTAVVVSDPNADRVTTVKPADIAAPATPYRSRLATFVVQHSFLRGVAAVDGAIMINCDTYSADWATYDPRIGFLCADGTVNMYRMEVDGRAAWMYRAAEHEGKMYGCVSAYALSGGYLGGACCYDRDGNVEWTSTYRWTGGGLDASRAAAGSTALYVGTGITSTVTGLMKFSLDGVLLWSKQYISPSWSWADPAAVTPDGGVLCSNSAEKIARLDSAGDVLWCKDFAHSPNLTYYYVDTVAIEGERIYAICDNYSDIEYAGIILAMSLTGELLWQKALDGYLSMSLIGEETGIIAVLTRPNASIPQAEIWVMRYSINGAFEWARRITLSTPLTYLHAHPLVSPSEGAMYINTYGTDADGISLDDILCLPTNGSGQGSYGGWVYENCDEPAADTGLWTVSDAAWLAEDPSPYTLVAQPYSLTLTPIAQHLGEDA